MNREFLRDAVNKAKTIHEAAILNAKKELTESLSPAVKELLSKKIDEMENQDLQELNIDEILDDLNETEDVVEGMEDLDESEELEESEDLDESEDLLEEEGEEEETETDGEEDEEIDLENMTDEDLKAFIEDVMKDMVEAGQIEPGEGFEGEDADMDSLGDDLELDLDMDMGGEEETEELEESEEIEESEKYGKIVKELNETKKQLKLTQSAIKQINEQNTATKLLNAKLFYTTKILKENKNLDDNNVLKIINAFDKVNSIRETKLVFETLQSQLTKIKSKSFTTKRRKVRESIHKKSSASSLKTSASVRKVLNETILPTTQLDRWEKIAGI